MFGKSSTPLLALLALATASPFSKLSQGQGAISSNPRQDVEIRSSEILESKRSNALGFIADYAGTSAYWMANIQRQGAVAFSNTTGYKVFRNVKDYGAKGDGSTDDTAAINSAVSDGNRCGLYCDSSTVTPALVYFPPGTYMVSTPLIQFYYTQFVGDAVTPPTLKATPNFSGMAVIDADPYNYQKQPVANWYTNQNNFFRQVRNFVIDLTAMPPQTGAGIHWQVAQATSLQNIRFEMVRGGANNRQQGVFMDNGSGGFMTDLIFNGGNQGMFVGNQQFTTRNLTFNNVNTAIFMNWNWLWTFKSVTINNCQVGIDMANNPSNQTVGSVLLQDSKIMNTGVGVNSSFSMNSIPTGGGTLILDNVDFTGTPSAVSSAGQVVLPGGSVVQSWAQGRTYAGSTGTRTQGQVTAPSKPAALLSNGNIFERSKPQYESVPASSFVSVKAAGAKGDGQTDDTKAIQNAINSLQDSQVLYFDHGAYIITSTVLVPGNKNIKITGEIWPLIMASGAFFQDQNNPKPVFQVGQAGDTGAVEMSDLIFETAGPAPGAVLMQWNSGASTQGANALYDVHFRVGGTAGTQLQSDKCSKNPTAVHGPNPQCVGANLLFHATQPASVYIENSWFWVADHELDLGDHTQVDIYNGRGVLLESQGPVWMYGTSSEHSVLYQYQLQNASNVYMGLIQSETPYYQSNPAAPAPFTLQPGDPQFTGQANADNMAWGLRIVDSSNVLVYGAGLYSFFDNYGQDCLNGETCQNRMVSVEGAATNVNLFGLSTKGAVSMVTSGAGYVASGQLAVGMLAAGAGYAGTSQVADVDNRSNFCATIALWRPQ
jgi:glucan 1,3-beta-glucosidase